MTEAHQKSAKIAVLKVSYLIAVTVVVFAVPALALTRPVRWFVIPTLLGIQVITLLVCRVGLRDTLWSASRLKWLFVFLLGMYALLPSGSPSENDVLLDWHVPGLGWSVRINVSGLEQASLMCLQIATVLLASAVVRLTGTRAPRAGLFAVAKQLLRGDVSAFAETIRTNIARAESQPGMEVDPRTGSQLAHDVAVVTGIALCMASLKMLKILPGLPFASGYKTFLLFPLYVLAARLTHSRWGATAAGSIMGVIGFLHGLGRWRSSSTLRPGSSSTWANRWCVDCRDGRSAIARSGSSRPSRAPRPNSWWCCCSARGPRSTFSPP